jgi:LacI family transcriptional regulator
MTTIREVAEKAGVSYTTVSHVINNTRFVAQETRARVLAAMEALNYRPNALAQSLRSGRTNTFGLILPDSSNPYFAEISRSIEDEAFKLGYSVIFCNTERDPHKEQLYIEVLSKKQVDGLIFVATGDRVDALETLLRQELPVVVVDRDFPAFEVDAVLTDNRQGGYLATRHLVELGHRRIACITGPSHITPSAERVTGYRNALLEAGLPFEEKLVLSGDYRPDSGRVAASVLLNRPDPPTALFFCNDLMAIGAMRAATWAGWHIPEQLSIVGFDDIEFASYTHPPLTTIAQPKVEVGYRAAHLLIDRINDKERPFQRVILPTRLIFRESSGPVTQKQPLEGKVTA